MVLKERAATKYLHRAEKKKARKSFYRSEKIRVKKGERSTQSRKEIIKRRSILSKGLSPAFWHEGAVRQWCGSGAAVVR